MMKPLERRVSSSGSSVEDEVEYGKLFCQPTQSGKHLIVNPDEMVYKTNSIALLRGKGQKDGSGKQPKLTFDMNATGPNRIFTAMYKLWLNGQLCDVVLETANGRVRAHKVVMATYSISLEQKFSDYPEGEIVLIDLTDIRMETVQQIVFFVYTNQINIHEDNLVELAFCAGEIGIGEVHKLCMEHLLRIIGPENAYHIYENAEKRNMTAIMDIAFRFMATDIVHVVEQPDFHDLTLEVLITLMNADEIDSTELEVFLAIVRWVDYNRASRMVHLPVLLRCIRYQYIQFDDVIKYVEPVTWVFEPRENHGWLYEVVRFHALRGCGSQFVHSYPAQRPRAGKRGRVDVGPLVTEHAQSEAPRDGPPTLHYLRMDSPQPETAQTWQGPVKTPDETK